MEIKHLKEKWVVYWEEIWEIEKEENQIHCSNWFNSEEKANAFSKILKEGKEIIRVSIKNKK